MNFKRPASTEIMTITPEIAQKMLNTSIGNRRVRIRHVNDLSGAMTRGEWRITSQGFGFDVNGNLRDGHHRLKAVCQSGVTIQSVVTFGMPLNAYEAIDTGANRSYADLLQMRTSVAKTLKLATCIVYNCSKPTIDQIKKVGSTGLLDLSEDLASFSPTLCRIFSSAAFKLSAELTVLDGESQLYVFEQYRALCLAEYDLMSPVIKYVCKRVQTGHIKTSNHNTDHLIMAYGLRVFNQKNADRHTICITEKERQEAFEKARIILQSKEPLKSFFYPQEIKLPKPISFGSQHLSRKQIQ